MSEEQLKALLAKLKEDAGLREKFQSAADLDAFLALAQEAGFDVTKADWMKYQARQTLELSDEELEVVSGGLILVGGACGNYFSLDPNQTYGHDCISTGGSVRREGDPGLCY